MNRRAFLKCLGLSAVAAAAPLKVIADIRALPVKIAALTSYPNFIPGRAYGKSVMVMSGVAEDWADGTILRLVREDLDSALTKAIPPAYRDAVEWFAEIPIASPADPLGQRGMVGWKYQA